MPSNLLCMGLFLKLWRPHPPVDRAAWRPSRPSDGTAARIAPTKAIRRFASPTSARWARSSRSNSGLLKEATTGSAGKAARRSACTASTEIEQAREAGEVVLVEGESDVHTLWHHGIPALGLPGAANWNEGRDVQHFDGIERIYVVVEPDKGGEAVRKWLAQSRIRHRASILELPAPAKDPSALHLQNDATFQRRWRVALLGALPWSAIEEKGAAEERSESWNVCADLAREHAILDLLDDELTKLGMVGERRCAKLVYLAVTSRLLERPVSVAVKGPSAGGKSFMVETTLRLFPPEAFHAMTAMSEKAVAYSNEPLKHRMLVIYEAAGMASEFGSYLIRSLLSEGRLRYETVEKTREGLVPKVIEREGPTGLVTTTTSLRLHPENETRLLSLSVTDTQEQTRAVFSALAEANNEDRNLEEWQALQTWLAAGSRAVLVPFAKKLASLVPPVAVRLRRDFKMILNLIRAHALLHQAQRVKDENGRILATVREDYACVRNLVADLVAAGVETGVPKTIQETVRAVAAIIAESPALTENKEVNQTELAARLKLDRAAVSRRVADCLERGYLRNLEERRPGKGRPARLVLGDQLPSEQDILPDPGLVDPLIGCLGGKATIPPPPRPMATGPASPSASPAAGKTIPATP